MGTYTTNYNLFMPTIGEQGWGDLVNGNFSTIDATMKSLSNRITAVENEVNGNLSCTSVTTSGKVTANGGIGTTSLTTSSTITANGIITGAKIKQTSATTVTSGNASTSTRFGYIESGCILAFVLPLTFYKYTGNVKVCNIGGQSIYYKLGFNGTLQKINYSDEGIVKTISFTNVDSVWIWGYTDAMSIGSVTLS